MDLSRLRKCRLSRSFRVTGLLGNFAQYTYEGALIVALTTRAKMASGMGEANLRHKHITRTIPVDLCAIDIQKIRESIQARTAYWGVRATRAPGPLSRSDGLRWVYIYWDGPPPDDIVPALAVSRCRHFYHISILEPREIFASGAFETMRRRNLTEAIELLNELFWEFRELALDVSSPVARSVKASLAPFDVS